jgi:phenylacetate-coenzyme A ligase PaaK-like adenylate-forming protein
MQLRRFRTQVIRAARETAYYGRLFEQLGLDPARLRYEDIQRIPPTPKEGLRDDPDAFVRQNAQPCFRTTTTGTTGRPTSVCFSQRELHTYVALGRSIIS